MIYNMLNDFAWCYKGISMIVHNFQGLDMILFDVIGILNILVRFSWDDQSYVVCNDFHRISNDLNGSPMGIE